MLMYLLEVSLKFKEESNIFFYHLRTFAMIKPDAYTHIGKIIDAIERNGFVIGNLKMTKMSLSDAH